MSFISPYTRLKVPTLIRKETLEERDVQRTNNSSRFFPSLHKVDLKSYGLEIRLENLLGHSSRIKHKSAWKVRAIQMLTWVVQTFNCKTCFEKFIYLKMELLPSQTIPWALNTSPLLYRHYLVFPTISFFPVYSRGNWSKWLRKLSKVMQLGKWLRPLPRQSNSRARTVQKNSASVSAESAWGCIWVDICNHTRKNRQLVLRIAFPGTKFSRFRSSCPSNQP